MKSSLAYLRAELDCIKKDNLYRKLVPTNVYKQYITVNGKKMLNLCSNDYLAISTTPIKKTQIQSSSRLLSGNDTSYQTLEKKLAKHKSKPASLVFPTGYMANLGVIGAFAKKGDHIFSDELNHASIIEACKLSRATIHVYKHNDTSDLEKRIKNKKGKKFIITEGIFSMDGDYASLDQITEVAQKNDAITILDDAHGDFVAGNGQGTPNHFGVTKKIDMYISSLSKGLGSFGGYLSSYTDVIQYCVNRSKPFIYTSALPDVLVQHAISRLNVNHTKYRTKLEKNRVYLARGLEEMGISTHSASQIIPIMVGDQKKALEFAKFLSKHGIFAQPIRYPTVPKNKARIRLSVTAWLSERDIQRTLDVIYKAKKFTESAR